MKANTQSNKFVAKLIVIGFFKSFVTPIDSVWKSIKVLGFTEILEQDTLDER